MSWVLQTEDRNLPEWLTSNLTHKCECGGEMENYYNEAGKITSRRCNNPSCFLRMAQKVVGICELLGVKGIGPEKSLSIIKSYKCKSHYEAIPHILNDKPTVDLYTFLRMSFIQGVDKGWAEVAEAADNLEEAFAKYKGKYQNLLRENEMQLREGLKYVSVREPIKLKYKPMITGTVMISGTLRDFPNDRNQFIAGINYASQGLISLSVAESKRKNGVMALIQEADTPNRGKAECAIENGIPIMTPNEFQTMVTTKLGEMLRMRKPELRE